MTSRNLWKRYQENLCVCTEIGLTLDISRMNFGTDFFPAMEPAMQRAYATMADLERGAPPQTRSGRSVGLCSCSRLASILGSISRYH